MNETSDPSEQLPKRRSSDRDLGDDTAPKKDEKKRESCIEKVQNLLADKCRSGKKVAIFTHPSPDPDAIGSMMGMAWLIKKAYEVEVDCYYDGHVSHPQNQRMCNLLDPELQVVSECDPSPYAMRICVDTVPAHAACPEGTDFDLVIDHHKEIPNGGFKGLFLNLKAGSCCATVYQLIKQHALQFE